MLGLNTWWFTFIRLINWLFIQGILTLFVLINFSMATFMDPGEPK